MRDAMICLERGEHSDTLSIQTLIWNFVIPGQTRVANVTNAAIRHFVLIQTLMKSEEQNEKVCYINTRQNLLHSRRKVTKRAHWIKLIILKSHFLFIEALYLPCVPTAFVSYGPPIVRYTGWTKSQLTGYNFYCFLNLLKLYELR